MSETVVVEKKPKIRVMLDDVQFELMANGSILVTLYWDGEMARLNRKTTIHSPRWGDNFYDLRDLLDQAHKIYDPNTE